ncbi:hypothetical protein HPULCUR_011070 [Helicostylum pulchrum]|uniref:Polyadenylate tail-binding protein n=1 Tax=Helicostylum pulchrum TaxID=562976 RepID=A0ABP9YF52_9FUNG
MATVKPIIKLPPRSKSCTTRSVYTDDFDQPQQQLVTQDLYFEDDNDHLSDYDIRRLLNEYELYNIKRERGGGYLSFPDSKIADRVYSLFNGYMFPNGMILKFRISRYREPLAEGPILEIRNLPPHIDHNTLYDIFRPYGPLSICKPILEDGTHRGKALVQFFYKQDSDSSVSDLDNKTFDGNTIEISVLMMNNLPRPSGRISQSVSSPTCNTMAVEQDNSFVDYMNLYVKNLDPTIDNTDLFNIFRKFGRIVSARVMSNPQNGLSKGYGFVSFGKPEEAALALDEMNGYQCRSKPMIVAYHEPKKPRQEKSSSTTTSSFHSPPPPPIDYASPTPYFDTRHPHEVGPLNGLGIDHVDHISMNMKDMSIGTTNTPMQRKLSTIAVTENSFSPPPVRTSPQFASRPSLASLASGASIQPAPVNVYEKIEEEKTEEPRSLRRRGSLESVNSIMTESTAHIQRQRMTDAVKQCGSYGSTVSDIVDMLLTLKRKERSICLFNPDFLKVKINAAVEALEVCEDESDSEEEEEKEKEKVIERKEKIEIKHRAYIPVSQMIPIRKKSISPPTTAVSETVVIPPRKSRAIPIVAPAKTAEIDAMLTSFDGKAIHEKKQLLGDQLFPLVKATGVKHAPRITIRLLDTIELEDLAKIMFHKDLLKVQVDKAIAGL